ncbi:MAG: RluA family pseudouridine synthase [Dehalococcoidia bacterium]|nr:RluA family pseudouridine synthase [Dehalococcoidia bacterium]
MTRTLELFADHDGERLDAFLARRCEHELSRSSAHRLIAEGQVTVNGAPSKPSHRLRHGDDIVVLLPPPQVMALEAEAIPLRIVYQDEDVILVDKPPGLTVHPAAGHPSGTLVNALLTIYPELANIKGTLRPGIVHRLDKDTSGLLVVAKNEAAQANLAGQLKNREVHKVYLALVRGRVEPPQGVIDAPIGRHPRRRQRMAVLEGGRAAQTRYRVRELLDDAGVAYSLVEAEPLTGRTHQIRVHLASIGHPVVGDKLYGKASTLVGRQFLHAWRLGFRLPASGRYQEFESPLPGDLAGALEALGGTAAG